MPREHLGDLLLRSGVLTQAQLVVALRAQASTGGRLGQIVVAHGMVDETVLYDAVARTAGVERFMLRTAILERSTLSAVTGQYAVENGVLPFRIEIPARTLHLAVTDPTHQKPVEELALKLRLKPRLYIASDTEVLRVLRHHFFGEPLDRDPAKPQRLNEPTADDLKIREAPGARRGSVSVPNLTPVRDRQAGPRQSERGERDERGPRSERGEADPLARLRPILEAQDEAARTLRAIFELCVARGVISREEYLHRLKHARD